MLMTLRAFCTVLHGGDNVYRSYIGCVLQKSSKVRLSGNSVRGISVSLLTCSNISVSVCVFVNLQ